MSNFISISQYNKATHGSEVVVKCNPIELPDLSFKAVNFNGNWFTEYPNGTLRTCTPVMFLTTAQAHSES